MVKFSIIVPAFNEEKYIAEALNSCKDQTFDDYEVLIVDDGSTDSTEEIVRPYLSDPRFHLFQTENRGLSQARNLGMDKATGEYIVFLDADDWLEPDMLQEVYPKLSKNQLDVLYIRTKQWDEIEGEQTGLRSVWPFREEKILSGEEVFQVCGAGKNAVFHEAWGSIYKNGFLRENQIFFMPNVYYEDVDFWFQVIRNADRIMYTNEQYYNYRIRQGSIMNSSINAKKIGQCVLSGR